MSHLDYIVGEIKIWSGASAPSGFLLCNGSAISRTAYSKLFDVIGVVYGVGDGSTTFNIPDLRQRFPLGKAASGTGSTLGEIGGQINHTHTVTITTDPVPVLAGLAQVGNDGTYTSSSNNPPFIAINFIIKY